MRIYISMDIEGIAGVATREHLTHQGFEYEAARRWMTSSLKAAIDGATAAGATEFVVSDSHGSGLNLLLDDLPDNVEVVRAWPRRLGMAAGVEHGKFAAAALIGYHSSVSEPRGGLAHTLSGKISRLTVNGRSMPEAGLTAAICGHHRVPIVFMAGDQVAIREGTALLGDIETVVTKHAYGFLSSRTMMPRAACEAIRTGMQCAVRRAASFRPFVIDGPIEMDVQLKDAIDAELCAYLPNVDCVGPGTVRVIAKDIVEVSEWLMFLISFKSALQ